MKFANNIRVKKPIFLITLILIFGSLFGTIHAQKMNETTMKFTIPFANAQEEASFNKMGGSAFGQLPKGSYTMILSTPVPPSLRGEGGPEVAFIEGDGLPLEVDCSAITDQNLQCRGDLPPVNFNLPIIVHSFGTVTKSALTVIPGNNACPGNTLIIPRTYFNLDPNDPNNPQAQINCMQTFTIENTIAPVLTAPADITLDCVNESTDPSNTGTAIVSGLCSNYTGTVGYSDVSTQTPFINGQNTHAVFTITRTWTLTETCGRDISAVQIINVDSTIGCPSAIPTMGQWGLIVLGLLMTIVSAIAIRARVLKPVTLRSK